MKRQEFDQLKTKDIESLEKLVSEKEREKATVHLELKMGKLKNVHGLRQLKKEIAKIKTIIAEKLFEEG